MAEFTQRTRAASADNRDFWYRMDTLRDQLLTGADSTVLLIQAAAACLLLLAILNLVALLVAWGFERTQEMAVRLALGGGRRQIIQLLVAQSSLIFTCRAHRTAQRRHRPCPHNPRRPF